MTFGERWELAESSEITILGKLVIVSSAILFIIKYGIYVFNSSISSGIGKGESIAMVAVSYLVLIIGLIVLLVVIWILGLVVIWIIDDFFDWDDLLEVIGTTYKLLFGDYKGKFDFIKVYLK